ncbi:MAG TPA: PepSY domain-containing protein [Motiliproteus sp.]
MGQAPALADRLSQDQVVELVNQGRIKPLAELLEQHRERLLGRLIDLELEYEHGRLVYELELIDKSGVVRDVLLDAQSGEWLGEDD